MSEPIIKTVTVSAKGQISLPRDIRKRLAVEKGTKLIIVLKEEKMLISKASDVSLSTVKNFDDTIQHTERSLIKMWDNEYDDIWNEYLKT